LEDHFYSDFKIEEEEEEEEGSRDRVRVRVFERCGMLQALMNLLSVCWKPFGQHGGENLDPIGVIGNTNYGGGGREGKDGLLWYRDIGKYATGDFSLAVVQANLSLEDQFQIESGPFGTFIGVYDGHGGPEAARYVCDTLFRHFQGSWFRNPSIYRVFGS
jgi:pyruvate dehydrogenase phosphatase